MFKTCHYFLYISAISNNQNTLNFRGRFKVCGVQDLQINNSVETHSSMAAIQLVFLSSQAENGTHQGKWNRKVDLVEQKTRFDRGSQGVGFDHCIKRGSNRELYIKEFSHYRD